MEIREEFILSFKLFFMYIALAILIVMVIYYMSLKRKKYEVIWLSSFRCP